MTHPLLLCATCSRHFRVAEPCCPFCGDLPKSRQVRRLVVPRGASRSAVYAARTAVWLSAATFACSETGEQAASNGDESSMTSIEPTTKPADPEPNGPTPTDATPTSPGPSNPSPTNDTPSGPSNTTNPSNGGSGGMSPDPGPEGMGGMAGTSNPGPDNPGPETPTEGGMACMGYAELPDPSQGCSSTAECQQGAVCSTQPVYTFGGVARPLPMEPPCPPVVEACSEANCDGTCQSDPSGCEEVCVPNCSEANCSGTAHCVDNVCTAKLCDLEGATACAEGWVCAPDDEYANALGCRALNCDEPGAIACQTQFECIPSDERADYRGCVRLLCDESGGPSCDPNLRCAPDDPAANFAGCVPIACDEADGQPCPEGYECEPESMWANQTTPGYVGCAPLACDDPGGAECPAGTHCVPDSTLSQTGCEVTRCDDGFACDAWRDCNVAAIGAGADNHGCVDRPCSADEDCACGYCTNQICTPEQATCRVPEIIATPYGCVWPDDEFV